MNTSYSKRRHIQEANDRLEKRMLNEQEVKVGDTINLFSSPNESNSTFKTQATIKGFLDDVNWSETQYKRKMYPGKIQKVISITAQDYNDATLVFSCPSDTKDSSFELRWKSGPTAQNGEFVYNKNFTQSMIKDFCSTKPDPYNPLRKTTVPKATFSSTEPVSSSMAEGKKVTKIIQEQKTEINQEGKKRFDKLSNDVSKGFCVPVLNQGSRMTIKCQDGHYWIMDEYRQFGKD